MISSSRRFVHVWNPHAPQLYCFSRLNSRRNLKLFQAFNSFNLKIINSFHVIQLVQTFQVTEIPLGFTLNTTNPQAYQTPYQGRQYTSNICRKLYTVVGPMGIIGKVKHINSIILSHDLLLSKLNLSDVQEVLLLQASTDRSSI